MDFENFEIISIGALQTTDRFGWVTATVGLSDAATGTKPVIEVMLPVQYRPDWTVMQVHEAALLVARRALSVANQGLSELDLRAEPEPPGGPAAG